jgi:hypothetical protein
MKTNVLLVLGLTSLFTTFIAVPASVHACSVCWGGDTGPIADAFNWSVLFLMAAPYTVMGSMAGWLFYRYRRATAKQETNEAGEPPVQFAFNPEESGR